VRRPGGSGNWLLTYTLDGAGLYRGTGSDLFARPGDIVLLGPDVPHDYSVPEGGSWEFLWAHFQPRLDWFGWWSPLVGEESPGLSHLESAGARERARRCFLRLHADALATGDLSRELALNGLEEILLLAVREGAGGRPLDPRVRRVAISPSRLSHLFKQEVGEPVVGAVIRLRLDHAARLLEHTVDDIGAIAREVGFGSPYYFSRQFRRHFGMSPRQYRTKAGNVRSDF